MVLQNFKIVKRLLIIGLISSNNYSQVNSQITFPKDQIVKEFYQKANNSAQIICFEKNILNYPEIEEPKIHIDELLITPLNESVLEGQILKRNFKVSNIKNNKEYNFNVAYKMDLENTKRSIFNYQIPNANLSFQGQLKGAYFSLTSKGVTPSLYTLNPQTIEDFSIKKIACSVNYARQTEIKINSSKEMHIVVHPHTPYDFQYQKITPFINERLKDETYNHLILLEHTSNYSFTSLTKFLTTGQTSIDEDWKVSLDIPNYLESNFHNLIKIAPAGYINYFLNNKSNNIFPNITYTGGFHNYCMTFNLIEVIKSYIKSSATNSIEIKFPVNSIIVQPRGYSKSMALKHSELKSSNHMGTYFTNYPHKLTPYLNAYLQNISYEINKLINYYSQIEVELEYFNQFHKELSHYGKGERKLKINLVFE